MRQLSLPIDWSGEAAPGAGFVGGTGNAAAIDLIRRPALWPSHCLILTGPRRSGRSAIGAAAGAADPRLSVIDDADRADEAMLFHAWNRAREGDTRLLFVTIAAPPRWAIRLPDLASRLGTAGVAAIQQPDEAMAEAILSNRLALAGTAFAPDVPRYLASRLPRCYQSIDIAIAALNDVSLSSARKISLAAAKQVLHDLGTGIAEP